MGQVGPSKLPEKGLARPASTHAPPPPFPQLPSPQPQPCSAHGGLRGGTLALRCSPCTGYFREARQTAPLPHRSCTLRHQGASACVLGTGVGQAWPRRPGNAGADHWLQGLWAGRGHRAEPALGLRTELGVGLRRARLGLCGRGGYAGRAGLGPGASRFSKLPPLRPWRRPRELQRLSTLRGAGAARSERAPLPVGAAHGPCAHCPGGGSRLVDSEVGVIALGPLLRPHGGSLGDWPTSLGAPPTCWPCRQHSWVRGFLGSTLRTCHRPHPITATVLPGTCHSE